MKKLFVITILLFSFLLLNKQELSAQIINKVTTRVYTVGDNSVEVSEIKKINLTKNGWYIEAGAEEMFTLFNPVKNDPEAEGKLELTRNSIKVTDNFGRSLKYSTELTEGGNIVLKVKFPVKIDSSFQYSIFLNYTSYGLITKNGKLRDVYIPSFAKDYKFQSENTSEEIITKVFVPKNFGEINFATPVNTITTDGDYNVVNFKKEDLVEETGWIQVGTEQLYKFKINQPYLPTSEAGFITNKYRLIVPRDVKSGPISQKVYFTNISPTPSNVIYDENENLILEFSIPANQKGSISIEGYSTLRQNNDIQFTNSGTLSQIPKEIILNNTKPSEFWQSDDPQIIKTAQELKAQVEENDKNVYELVSNTYKFVIDKIDYSDVKRFGINERQGAVATLNGGAAVCMEYSDLFIALMRAQGVPARAAFGYGYSALDSEETDQNINHQWAEVYIPSLKEWVSVDTTWGESGQNLIGGDLNHFYTHVASLSPETPSTTEVNFYGDLSRIQEKEMNVTVLDKLPEEKGRSGEDLFNEYHKDEENNLFKETVTKSRLMLFEIDRSISTFLKNTIPGISDATIVLIKLTPLLLISIVVIYKIYRKFNKRNLSSKF